MAAGEFQEGALADPGIAGDDEHPAPAVPTVVQELQELLTLAVTADQHDQMLVVYRPPILPAGSGAEEQKAVNGALRAYSCATPSGPRAAVTRPSCSPSRTKSPGDGPAPASSLGQCCRRGCSSDRRANGIPHSPG